MTAVEPDAFNAFERASWESAAEPYAAFWSRVTGRVIEPLLDAAGVAEGTRMLDAATGPGHVAAAARARGAAVTAVDVAEAMVSRARAANPGADVRRADAEALPFADRSFDAVVASFLLLHLGHPERAAGELARVAVPGGRVAVTVWDYPDRAKLFGIVLEAAAEAGAVPPADLPQGHDFFRFSDEGELRKLLEEAGLAGVSVQTVAFEQGMDGEELWVGMLEGTVRTRALLRAQDADTRERIRASVERRMSDVGGVVAVSVKLGSGRRPE